MELYAVADECNRRIELSEEEINAYKQWLIDWLGEKKSEVRKSQDCTQTQRSGACKGTK